MQLPTVLLPMLITLALCEKPEQHETTEISDPLEQRDSVELKQPKCCDITASANDYNFFNEAEQARFERDAAALCKKQLYSTPFRVRASCQDIKSDVRYVVCDNANNIDSKNSGDVDDLHYDCKPHKGDCVTCPPQT